MSERASRSKKFSRLDFDFLGDFFSFLPFIEELAYVSCLDMRSKNSSFSLSLRLLRDLPNAFILALAKVSSFDMRSKNESVVFPVVRGIGSTSIFPFILAEAYVSCPASRLNSEADTGAVRVVIWEVDVRVVYLDAPVLVEDTELDEFCRKPS